MDAVQGRGEGHAKCAQGEHGHHQEEEQDVERSLEPRPHHVGHGMDGESVEEGAEQEPVGGGVAHDVTATVPNGESLVLGVVAVGRGVDKEGGESRLQGQVDDGSLQGSVVWDVQEESHHGGDEKNCPGDVAGHEDPRMLVGPFVDVGGDDRDPAADGKGHRKQGGRGANHTVQTVPVRVLDRLLPTVPLFVVDGVVDGSKVVGDERQERIGVVEGGHRAPKQAMRVVPQGCAAANDVGLLHLEESNDLHRFTVALGLRA